MSSNPQDTESNFRPNVAPTDDAQDIEQSFRINTTAAELAKTGAIDAAKVLIRHTLLDPSSQYHDAITQEKSRLRLQALDDEKVHYCIHLMKSFLKQLGCERTWETFLLEMDLEDDKSEFDHKEHFHWLTTEVKPLKKEYDILEGRLPEEKQTLEAYIFQDHNDNAPYGALYSFVSDSWQTKQELNNNIIKEQCRQVEGTSPEQIKELLFFMQLNKQNLSQNNNNPQSSSSSTMATQLPSMQQNGPTTPSNAASTTPISSSSSMRATTATAATSATTPTSSSSTTTNTASNSHTPNTSTTRRTTSSSSSSSSSRPTSGRTNSPATRPLNTNTNSMTDPVGSSLSFNDIPNASTNNNNNNAGTSFMLPGASALTPQLRPSSRPSSPARTNLK